MRTYQLRLSMICPGCAAPLPLDAMTPTIACAACGRAMQLGLPDWKHILEEAVLQAASGLARVRVQLGSVTIGGQGTKVNPVCDCGAAITEDELFAVDPAQPWSRHRCGASLLVRSFPELESVGRIVGESSASAPRPAGSGFFVALHGALADRVHAGLQFHRVDCALADAEGNLYCTGTFRVPRSATVEQDEDDDDGDGDGDGAAHLDLPDPFDGEEPWDMVHAVWSWDPSMRVRWKVDVDCDRIASIVPGTVSGKPEEEAELFTLSMADGAGLGAVREVAEILPFAHSVRDADGTHVVSTMTAIKRVSAAKDWGQIPLFLPKTGFFERMLALDDYPCEWNSRFAIASDGDLVIDSRSMSEGPKVKRFDRHGHCRLSVPSPLEPPEDAVPIVLAAGPGGVVWIWGHGRLCAVTTSTVHRVELPPDAESFDSPLVAMPDGSLIFFDTERVVRATMNGFAVSRWETLIG